MEEITAKKYELKDISVDDNTVVHATIELDYDTATIEINVSPNEPTGVIFEESFYDQESYDKARKIINAIITRFQAEKGFNLDANIDMVEINSRNDYEDIKASGTFSHEPNNSIEEYRIIHWPHLGNNPHES